MRKLLRARTLAVVLAVGAAALIAADTTGFTPISETSRIEIDLPTVFDTNPEDGVARNS